MSGNLAVNFVLAAVLYGLFVWTPWASLVLALLSSIAFGYIVIFDREFLDQIARLPADRISIVLGLIISFVGICVSVVALLFPWLKRSYHQSPHYSKPPTPDRSVPHQPEGLRCRFRWAWPEDGLLMEKMQPMILGCLWRNSIYVWMSAFPVSGRSNSMKNINLTGR